MSRWPAYTAYKDAGVAWLGEIPAHWEATLLKRIADTKSGAGFPHEEQGVSEAELPFFKVSDMNTLGNEVYLQHPQNCVTHETSQNLGASIFPSGSIVFPKVGAALLTNKRRILKQPSCIDNNVMALTLNDGVVKYIYYQLLGIDLAQLANPGAVPSVNESQINEINIAYPPPPEQRAIAAFLDRETTNLAALTRRFEQLLDRLEEQRAALISHAVTKGLDPDVEMKASGIPWLGEIPAHWEVVRNGALFERRDERNYPDLPILNVSIHTGVNIREFSSNHIEQMASDRSVYKRAKKGDIAYNKMRMWQGAVGTAPVDGLVSPDYTVARPRSNADPKYYERLFRTEVYKAEVNRYSHGIVPDRNRLYWDQFKAISSPHPPYEEQHAINAYLDRETARIDTLAAKVRAAIARLDEYRTALISAAVTGKIDVRGAS